MSASQSELYIGLMSGTSMDGIDAALVDFSSMQPKLVCSNALAWPDDIQQALIEARNISDNALHTVDDLDMQTAEVFAQACHNLLDKTDYTVQDITAIGSHGQTIRHRPDIPKPFSLQIGNAKKLAELTTIDVISDFRTADIQVGGQGAPLAPAFHQVAFRDKKISRAIVNIGGISNITWLSSDEQVDITGFDCGPGNTLMDAWMFSCKQQSYDKNGEFANSGKTHATFLAHLLMDDYFQLAPPKSTGFEYFNLQWLSKRLSLAKINDISDADMQSTLCDLTATSIIRAINQYTDNVEEILVCGGGAHNATLMKRIQSLTKYHVQTTEKLGVNPDWVEAMAFAWLAYRHKHQQTGNLPSVTGARESVILGKLTEHRA